MKRMSHAMLALAIVALAACHKNEPVSTTQSTSATLEKRSLADDDRAFVTKVMQDEMLEVALGEHATRKAAASDVREYGQMMVTDHSIAEEELKNIAQAKGVDVPLQMDSDHRATYDKLAQLKGKKLDREYADDMVEDREEDVKEFKEAARNLADPALRAWAAKSLPTLENHLDKAKSLKQKLD